MVELLTRAKNNVNKFYTCERYSEIALITAVRLGYKNITQTLALHSSTEVEVVDSVSCLVLTNRTNHPNNLCPALTVVSSPTSWSSSNIPECGELSSLTHLHT